MVSASQKRASRILLPYKSRHNNRDIFHEGDVEFFHEHHFKALCKKRLAVFTLDVTSAGIVKS